MMPLFLALHCFRARCEEEWLSGKLANLSATDVEQTVDDNFKEGMDGQSISGYGSSMIIQ
jgi:hypothetical protein